MLMRNDIVIIRHDNKEVEESIQYLL